MEPFLNNQTLVQDFLTEDRCWDKTLLEQILPHELVEIVMGCPLARFVIGSDKFVLSLNSNGIFSTKSVYNMLRQSNSKNSLVFKWSVIFRLKVPARVQLFLWLVVHEGLLTNVFRTYRHIGSETRCSICSHPYEDVIHVLS